MRSDSHARLPLGMPDFNRSIKITVHYNLIPTYIRSRFSPFYQVFRIIADTFIYWSRNTPDQPEVVNRYLVVSFESKQNSE
jgi:hypothetical protein